MSSCAVDCRLAVESLDIGRWLMAVVDRERRSSALMVEKFAVAVDVAVDTWG